MTRRQKARAIGRILHRLYPEVESPLTAEDPFTLLIAVILSAQCTDANVERVTPVLFQHARTPSQMAALGADHIERLIRSCGLAPTKSRHICQLSRLLCERFDGRVPASFEALESLPGVGHKTASVVMAQAFGLPAFPVDTHIHRLAWRWGLSNGANVAQTEADLKRLFTPSQWHATHLQIIFYGREHCPARGHDLADCPICRRYGVRSRMN